MRFFRNNNLPWNGLGGALSLLCLIHCLALPWLAVLLPVAPLLHESMHLYLFLLLAPIAAYAAWKGLRKHGKGALLLFFGTGLVLAGIAVFAPLAESLEIALTVVGSLLLTLGHALNSHQALFHRTAQPS